MPTRFRIKEALEESNMTQAEAARLSGLGLATISRMCRYPARSQTLEILDRLSGILRVEPGELITRAPILVEQGRKPGPGRPRITTPYDTTGPRRVGTKWTRRDPEGTT